MKTAPTVSFVIPCYKQAAFPSQRHRERARPDGPGHGDHRRRRRHARPSGAGLPALSPRAPVTLGKVSVLAEPRGDRDVMPAESTRPRVAVIIPVYNGGPFLPLALESVMSQTFTDFVVAVVNDGSTDGWDYEKSCQIDPRSAVFRPGEYGLAGGQERGHLPHGCGVRRPPRCRRSLGTHEAGQAGRAHGREPHGDSLLHRLCSR